MTPQNRVSQAGSTDSAFAYDASGNVLSDGLNIYSYDGEGRLHAVNGATNYVYGPEGERVATVQSGAVSAEYLYGTDGTLTTELAPGGKLMRGLLYGGGMHLADYTQDGKTVFHLSDEVGSLVNTIDQTGAAIETCAASPFGESLNCSPSVDYTENHFTDKKRDQESGLDYFGARYYSSTESRFTSPDSKPPSMKFLMNPQKWNKYAYVLNNPLSLIDPDGMEEMTIVYRTFIAPARLNFFGTRYVGDNRGFSSAPNAASRSSISVRIEIDPSIRPGNPIISQTSSAGQSRTVDANGNTITSATQTQGLPTATGTRDLNGNAVIGISQDVKNPLSPGPQFFTPGIAANLSMNFTQDGSSVITSGTASNFPSQELNVSGVSGASTPVFQFTPSPGSSPMSLFLQDRNVNCTTTGERSSCY